MDRRAEMNPNPSKLRSGTFVDVVSALKRAMMRKGKHPVFIAQNVENSNSNNTDSEPAKDETHELIGIAAKSHDILHKANTVFPFTLFPDTITLDREKLTVASRYFFNIAKITSVPVRDILSVEAHLGPFFGSLRTSSRYFITNPYNISFLKRIDAVHLQRLLQGYIIAHEQGIDCSDIGTKELKKLLHDLGAGDTA
jgi:hypothetical protein